MDRAETQHLERLIDREVRARFGTSAIDRVAVLNHDDDPAIEPDELLVRVIIPAGDPDPDPDHLRQLLDTWAADHAAGMRRMRRELSLRLPQARMLEFTVATQDDMAPAPRIQLPEDPDLTSTPLTRHEAIETILQLLRAGYIFPDRAEQAAVAVRARLAAGDYDDLDEEALAEQLTTHLYEVCADKHLRVRSHPEPDAEPDAEPDRPRRVPKPERPARPRPGRGRLVNHGVFAVQRLDGNIGYIDLRGVADPDAGGDTIAAAMQLISSTYALILDLRRNGGGSPDGAAFWCSYLLPPGTHLNDIYEGETGETRQFWSMPYVPGARYLERPVYVLTSARTFSGGEDIAYNLQAQGRAQVVGETTGGGAHPTRGVRISPTLMLTVPHARSVNPVTGTNWEGTGVIPDIPVPADQARDAALAMALRQVIADADQIGDVPPPIRDEASQALGSLSQARPETSQVPGSDPVPEQVPVDGPAAG